MRSLAFAALLAVTPALAAEPAPKGAAPKPAPSQGGAAQQQQQPAEAGKPGDPPPSRPLTPADVDKALYGIGLLVARNLEVFALTPAEIDHVMKAVRDGLAGKPKHALDPDMQRIVNDLVRTRTEKAAAKEKEQGTAHVAKMAKEKGAKKSPSGAIVIPLKEGTGATPGASDKVKVHYTGTLLNGKVFDSSRQRGQPAEFPLNGVIKCWTEALQMMKVGGSARVVCPSDLAYGPNGTGAIPGNAVLTFEIELLDIVK